jgi:hypothetical protein
MTSLVRLFIGVLHIHNRRQLAHDIVAVAFNCISLTKECIRSMVSRNNDRIYFFPKASRYNGIPGAVELDPKFTSIMDFLVKDDERGVPVRRVREHHLHSSELSPECPQSSSFHQTYRAVMVQSNLSPDHRTKIKRGTT